MLLLIVCIVLLIVIIIYSQLFSSKTLILTNSHIFSSKDIDSMNTKNVQNIKPTVGLNLSDGLWNVYISLKYNINSNFPLEFYFGIVDSNEKIYGTNYTYHQQDTDKNIMIIDKYIIQGPSIVYPFINLSHGNKTQSDTNVTVTITATTLY